LLRRFAPRNDGNTNPAASTARYLTHGIDLFADLNRVGSRRVFFKAFPSVFRKRRPTGGHLGEFKLFSRAATFAIHFYYGYRCVSGRGESMKTHFKATCIIVLLSYFASSPVKAADGLTAGELYSFCISADQKELNACSFYVLGIVQGVGHR
jgi:hypothetical protein